MAPFYLRGAVAACGLAGGGDIPKLQVFPFILQRGVYWGAVAACGLAGGGDIPKLQVFPFILRNVRLLGVDSAMAAPALRERAWKSP
ncbi:hypothetical protein T484DRAFT_1856843 [Baffinella frigidus]|nr:hypothetical protein T484DRAFT_1856843 [Cryptophyta sp. CCMP2293]